MEQLLGVREGTLPNTVFCLLAPDGKTQLTRPSRSPDRFGSARNLAFQMGQLRQKYEPNESATALPPVPYVHGVDLAMNVAASDNRPLVVAYGSTQEELDAINKKLLRVVWTDAIIGQFMYGFTTKEADLKVLSGDEPKAGVFVVEPDEFGTSGKVTQQVGVNATADEISEALAKSLKSFTPFVKDHRQHIQSGYVLGLEWETVVPESDPMSVQAKQRFKARFKNSP